MAFDGLFLQQIQKALCVYIPAKITKLQQLSSSELLFTLRTSSGNKKLLISLHSVYNRINLSDASYTTMESPSNFIMVLRKHIDGAIIRSLTQIGLDRILHMKIDARNELGDIHTLHLYIELMGKYANMILVNEEGYIIDALKRIPPFENSKRTIHPGALFQLPAPHTEKQDPYHYTSMQADNFAKQFHGFSPLLSKEMQYRLQQGQNFDSVMQEIAQSNTLYQSELKDTLYFHCIPLTHLEVTPCAYPLMHGMDLLYHQQEEKVRIKQQSGDLFRTIKKELHKNTAKLPKLQQALDEAMNCENYRIYGDLLFSYIHSTHKAPVVTLPSFDSDKNIDIPLDMRFDIKGNANLYYKKYHKAKRAQDILQVQIALCNKELQYFEGIELHLEQATIQDAIEIREELVKQGYIKARKMKIRKKKKLEIPHYQTLVFGDIHIYIGKNNIQNDYLTWKVANKSDTWLHTKDIHGAHVIITDKQPSEELLRNGAMLAAWFSKGRYSSSVPVDYCFVRQLKKIPGNKGSLVSLSNYKTIYIDPDPSHIQMLFDTYTDKKQ